MSNTFNAKYSKDIPVFPSKKDLDIRKLNGFGRPNTNIYCWEVRIGDLKHLSKHLPYLPDEIWSFILIIQMYLEKKEYTDYKLWLYSDYSKKTIKGMKLRNRQLYLPTILGIVLNEGFKIVEMAKENMIEKNEKKIEKFAEHISKKFLLYIIRWFHWLNTMNYCKNGTNWLNRYAHLIYELKLKSDYFIGVTNLKQETMINFQDAHYYINYYYPSKTWDWLNYNEQEFECYIFYNDYYNNVYRKSIQLRNGKRINMFLHH